MPTAQAGQAQFDLSEQAFVRFPPRWRNILVPIGLPRATALGMTLYTACNPLPVLAQNVLWALATLSRGRLAPGPRESWRPPIDADVLAPMWGDWNDLVGRVEGIAVYERIQSDRVGMTLMVCGRRRAALVRVRTDAASFDRERAISAAAGSGGVSAFRVPTLVGSGESGPWSWVAYEVMSRHPHLPVTKERAGLADEISALVERTVERPAGTPGHWRGAHGDLTPWNLRRARSGTWLIDWEDAAWLPPGADAVYFRAVTTAIGRAETRPMILEPAHEEARVHWRTVLAGREAADGEQRLHARLAILLAEPDSDGGNRS